MPPKDFIKWDNNKALLMSADGKLIEMGEIVENPILGPICEMGSIYNPAPITVRFSFTVKCKNKTRLLQELGLWKRPKLTYKTNRHYKRPKHHRKH